MPVDSTIDPAPRSATAGAEPARQGGVEVVDYDRYIDDRILRTRRMVKVVDAAHALLLLAAGWAVLLAVAAVLEHWVIRGGFTVSGRYALFGAALAASVGLLAVRLLPVLTRRVNPLYAADAIEQASPSLKNTLVNLLLLRREGRAPAALSDELEREAAERIAGLGGEASIDRAGVIRLGYVIVSLLVVLLLYAFLSPKSPFATVARVLAPWADIAAPTRVRILEVTPGDAEVAQGGSVTVAAVVRDLAADEQVWLVASSADRRSRDQRLPMISSGGGDRFQLRVPTDAPQGLQQDLVYRIEAGDARSRRRRLRVVTAPSIVVRRVRYHYPDYTGYLDRDAPNAADLRAIEGTRVRVEAAANLPIDTAQLDLSADGRPDVRMAVDDRSASAEFLLELRADRRTPRHSAYALRLTTADGRANTDPVAHRIEVIPDLAPEVEIVKPEETIRDVRLDETVAVHVRARDPDFGLATLELLGDRPGLDQRGKVFRKPLISARTEGQFESVFRFCPSDFGLRVGDEVAYSAVAIDVKQPGPHRVATPPRRFRVVGAVGEEGSDEASGDQPKEEGGETQADGDGGRDDRPNEKSRRPADPEGSATGDRGESPPGGFSEEPVDPSAGGSETQDGASESPPRQAESADPAAGQQGDRQEPDEQNPDKQTQAEEQQQPGEEEGRSGRDGGAGIQGEQTNGSGDAAESQNPSTGGGGESLSGDRSPESGSGNAGGGSGANQPTGGERNGRRSPGAGGQNNGQQSPASEPSDPSGNASDNPQAPVASDGENDAEAFDRIEKFLDQQAGEGEQRGEGEPRREGGQRSDNRQPGASDNRSPGAESPANKSPANESPANGRPGGDADPETADDPAGRPPTDTESSRGDSPTSENTSRRQSDAPGADEPQTRGGGERGRGEEAPRDGTGSAGESNAADDGKGRSADRGAGDTVDAPGDGRPSDTPTGEPGGDQPGDGTRSREAPSGDRTNGSGAAGGQQPNPVDRDAGDPSDDGAASPSQDGEQSTSDRATEGPDRGSADPSGAESGKVDRGAGSPNGDGPAQPDARGSDRPQPSQRSDETEGPGRGANADSADRGSEPPRDPARSEQANRDDGDASTPGGRGGRRPGEELGRDEKTPPGDKANLDYARQRTDLILDKLSERLREKNVDRRLLDELGWSEDDLRRFVDRWQSRKRRARTSAEARAELDEDLRSLGLTPGRVRGRVDRAADKLRVDSGYRSQAPAAVRERLKAYNAGVSRGAGDDNKR